MNNEAIGQQKQQEQSPETVLRSAIEKADKNCLIHEERLIAHKNKNPKDVELAFKTVKAEYEGDQKSLDILADIEQKVFGVEEIEITDRAGDIDPSSDGGERFS